MIDPHMINIIKNSVESADNSTLKSLLLLVAESIEITREGQTKVDVRNLTGDTLHWVVASCQGYGKWDGKCFTTCPRGKACSLSLDDYKPSENWSQAGPLIQAAGLALSPDPDFGWCCYEYEFPEAVYHGKHPLLAAMRCFASTAEGNKVEIPTELAQ